MRSRLLGGEPGRRTWTLVGEPGDAMPDALLDFARREGIGGAGFVAIGGFSRVVLGYFDRDRKDYLRNALEEQVEVVSLAGNVARVGQEIQVHGHAVVGRRDGSAIGGHLLEARVWPTLELLLTETPSPLERRKDEATGLPLLVP